MIAESQHEPSTLAGPRERVRRRRGVVVVAALALAAPMLASAMPATATPGNAAAASQHTESSTAQSNRGKPRTVITTDGESDDFASLVRYLLYTDGLDTRGIVYTSSKFHWAGDGQGTEFFLPDREYTTPQTSWRWTGTHLIQDTYLKAYARVYPNLRVHARGYPSPRELLAKVLVGNIEFEGEMAKDTPGSNLIRRLLLDADPRPVYLQAWGGTNTIARALKSIEERYSASNRWAAIKERVSRKAVILASGFQDLTYAQYIAPTWPQVRVEDRSDAYGTWGFNCDFFGTGNTRGEPDAGIYFQGSWMRANIQIGPLGSLYRSWLDGQTTAPDDPLDVFGGHHPVGAGSDRMVPADAALRLPVRG